MEPPTELLQQALETGDTEKVSEFLNTMKSDDTQTLADLANFVLLILEKAASGDEPVAKLLLETAGKLALKDQKGLSILDHLVKSEKGGKLVKDVLIQPLLLSGDNQMILEQMAMSGWSDFSLQLQTDTEVPEEAKTLIATLTDQRIKATLIQAAIRDGRLEDVQTTLTDPKILKTAGISGLFPLEQAVVYNNEDVVKHILTTFPEACSIQDGMGRTALHYAAGCDDGGNLYQILKEAGSNEEQEDAAGNSPKYYSEHPEKIQASEIKSTLENLMKGGTKEASRPASGNEKESNADATSQEPNNIENEQAESDPKPQPEPEPEIQRAATPPRPKTPPGPKKVKPVPMYVRYGGANQAQAPPPTTMDGKYIAQHLGTALTLALAEIAERRPWDPIEYLAQWLYDYHKNEAYTKQQEDMLKTIREAEAKQNEIEELKFKRKEELLRLQEDEMRKQKEEEEEKRRQELEELQRSNKEAALAQKPQLPTVKEDEEAETEADVDDDPSVKDRDTDGLIEMHKLASQPDIDLKSLIDLGYSVADRDIKGRTARDIAQEAGRKETVQAIDNYTKQLLSDGIVSTLEKMVLEGYDDIELLADENLPEVTKNFLQNLGNLKEKMAHITKLSETGKDDEVKEVLEALPQLAQMKDRSGHSLLHRAVVCDNVSVADYLSSHHSNLLQARDNKNRTPLHYAHNKSEDIAKLLINKGAKPNSRDVYKKLPAFYKDNPVDDALSESATVADPESTMQEQTSTNNADQSSENIGDPETTPEASLLATTSISADQEPQATLPESEQQKQ